MDEESPISDAGNKDGKLSRFIFRISELAAATAVILFFLWKHGIPWAGEALVYILIAGFVICLCYSFFSWIGIIFRFINRTAERFVNGRGQTPDDTSESN
jgi:hypothetical protein